MPRGRKPGVRNTATLMREQTLNRLLSRAQGYLVHELEAVLRTVVTKAIDGDMTAAKLVMQYSLPAQRSLDGMSKQAIQINIVSANPELEVIDHAEHPQESITDEHPEGHAVGQATDESQGGEGWDGSEEGEQPGPDTTRSRLN